MTSAPAQIASLAMEVDINAAPDAVWAALTDNIGEWWPAEFYSGGEEGSRTYILEATPGGRMYEEWADGGGTLWGTVTCVDRGRRLQVVGVVFPQWGGPTQWFATWDLEGKDGRTTLRFSESGVGNISDSGMEEKDVGWTFLWATLKAHIEGTTPPTWE